MNSLSKITKPLAITMWDSSWLRRRYVGGGFEDWDQALDELVARGYNAVRIDVFPHLVAKGPDGDTTEEFISSPGKYPQWFGFAYWGNQWTVRINPRKSLPEFIKKCEAKGVYVGLSTWFKPTNEHRNEMIEGLDEFVRVWDETLRFLADNDCMNNVIYVDLLNEYPMGHSFWWLHNHLRTMTQPCVEGCVFNEQQKAFYRNFINDAIDALKKKWSDLAFGASLATFHMRPHDMDMDFSHYDFLDIHVWHSDHGPVNEGTGYFDTIFWHGAPDKMFRQENACQYGPEGTVFRPTDTCYEAVYEKMLDRWQTHKETFAHWLDEKVAQLAALAKKWEIPLGNTEGWGPVNWFDHPALDWRINKECGLMAAKAGHDNGYLFNCSSNMCEPQFTGLWRDVDWHRQVTSLIRGL